VKREETNRPATATKRWMLPNPIGRRPISPNVEAHSFQHGLGWNMHESELKQVIQDVGRLSLADVLAVFENVQLIGHT